MQALVAFILSNIHRRHMTKSQQVLAYAVRFPDPENVKRAGSPESGIQTQRLAEARVIIENAIDGDLAQDVLSGAPVRGRCQISDFGGLYQFRGMQQGWSLPANM